MRKRALPAVFAFALVAACSDQPIAPAESVPAPQLAVKVVDVSEKVPFGPQLIFNDCTNEDVLFEGTTHRIFRAWDNGHAKIKIDVQLTGEGQTSGLTYKGHQTFNNSVGPGGLPFAFTLNVLFVSATSADNYVAHVRITVNENGEFTVGPLETIECVG